MTWYRNASLRLLVVTVSFRTRYNCVTIVIVCSTDAMPTLIDSLEYDPVKEYCMRVSYNCEIWLSGGKLKPLPFSKIRSIILRVLSLRRLKLMQISSVTAE
jgi:hypothetical protein